MIAGLSPVLTHLSASIEGLHTIRAFHREDRLSEDFNGHMDCVNGVYYTYFNVWGWFTITCDAISAIFSITVLFTCLTLAAHNIIG